jgi:hypothetical protein
VNLALQAVALAAVVAAGTQYTVLDSQGHVIGTLTTDAPVATSSQMRVIGIAQAGRPADSAAPIDKTFHPNYDHALTVEQMTHAWQAELDRLNPPIVTGGG